ncbi:hypothetical protein FKP32DRAFT_1595590 [Trametes sanguinea]|nr:hypothetical protein FKP32DRAFT_1595590 [Trametes sanguinea]
MPTCREARQGVSKPSLPMHRPQNASEATIHDTPTAGYQNEPPAAQLPQKAHPAPRGGVGTGGRRRQPRDAQRGSSKQASRQRCDAGG